MRSEIYWISANARFAGRLALSARPRGGDWLEDEVRAWRQSGVDHVVSLLTAEEVRELDLEAEARQCGLQGLEFTSVPVEDRGLPPSAHAFMQTAHRLWMQLREGRGVLVHCRQGIGRSSLLAASVLVQGGVDGPLALEMIEQARGRPVPDTEEQRDWLRVESRLYGPGDI